MLVELKKKVSDEQRAIDSQKSIIHELVVVIPPSPLRSSRIFHPPEGYMNMLTKKVEKIFFMGDKGHEDDLNIFDEAMSDFNLKK